MPLATAQAPRVSSQALARAPARRSHSVIACQLAGEGPSSSRNALRGQPQPPPARRAAPPCSAAAAAEASPLKEDVAAAVPEVWGRVHSIETFGAVDGPGLRFVVFTQGCGFRCLFCSNPDTWDSHGGTRTSSKELAGRLDKVAPYLLAGRRRPGGEGGITLSGGEAMLQPQFVVAMCQEARARGLSTCIDTTGAGRQSDWDLVLPHLDYVLVCLKSPRPDKFAELTGQPPHVQERTKEFVEELEKRQIPYWLRYVLIPGMTDAPEDVEGLISFCHGKHSLQAVEVLPLHALGQQKWKEMGLEYPLENFKRPSQEAIQQFVTDLESAGVTTMCAEV